MWLGNKNIMLGTYLGLGDKYLPCNLVQEPCNKFLLAGNQNPFYKGLVRKGPMMSYEAVVGKQANQPGNENPWYYKTLPEILAHKSLVVSQEPVVCKYNRLQSLICKSLTCNQNPSCTVLPGIREL